MTEVLVWKNLASCVDNFKEELRSWSSEERALATQQLEEERRAQLSSVQQEAKALADVLEVSAEEPWDRLKELVSTAKAQKEQLTRICGLLRQHAKLLQGSKLEAKIPKEDGEVPRAEELHRLVVAFLEYIAEKQTEAAGNADKDKDKDQGGKDEEQEASEDEEEEVDGKKGKKKAKLKKSKAKDKKGREEKRRKKSSKVESDGGDDYSDYSYSRTPTPRPRRRRKRPVKRRRRRRRPSPSSYSYSPSPRPRRKRRRREREDKLDVDAEIDRFVKVNKLEERCEKILRDLDSSLACKVMGLSGGNNTFELSGDVRDPTAVVLARIRKAQFAHNDGARGRRGGRRRRSSSSRSR